MTPYEYALIANESYSAKPDIGEQNSASRAIVRETSAGRVIAFTGSDNLQCWKADFDIDLVDAPGIGKIHHGFWRSWKVIEGEVLQAAANAPTTFVGHSLGAALAIMASLAATISGKPPTALYAFEPPRVSPSFNVAIILAHVPKYLYKNGNDIVPDVPLLWQHAGPITRIGAPLLPIPNVRDHIMPRVLAALG